MSTLIGLVYGEGTYGDASPSGIEVAHKYGNPLAGISLPTYSARPLTAVPDPENPYTGVQLSWVNPNIGYQMRLVRNSYSQPADQSDGVNLAQFTFTAAPLFVDSLTADSGGMWLYYSLFMLSSGSSGGYWIRAADCQYMLPKNWGYGARMFGLVPNYYQSLDDDMDDPIYYQPHAQSQTIKWQTLVGNSWANMMVKRSR